MYKFNVVRRLQVILCFLFVLRKMSKLRLAIFVFDIKQLRNYLSLSALCISDARNPLLCLAMVLSRHVGADDGLRSSSARTAGALPC